MNWVLCCTFITLIFVNLFQEVFVDGTILPIIKENGPVRIQKFYFNETWNNCLAFVYNGTKRDKQIIYDSPSCVLQVDRFCEGPNPSKKPLNDRVDLRECEDAVCPCGYTCSMYHFLAIPLCCESEQYYATDAAYSKTCPDGRKAGGVLKYGYFHAIFGESCNDLICGEKEKCVQVNRYFAKCCGVTKPYREVEKVFSRKSKKCRLRNRSQIGLENSSAFSTPVTKM